VNGSACERRSLWNVAGDLAVLTSEEDRHDRSEEEGDRNQWEKEGVGGNRKQDNSDEASRSNTDTANQNSGTGKRR
jgi:hypothetical protein